MKKLLTACLLLVALSGAASAQATQQQGMPYSYPKVIQTTPLVVLPFNAARKQLVFVNPNPVAIVAVCPAVDRITSIFVFCAVNGDGAIPILPYAIFTVAGIGGNPSIPQSWVAVANIPNSNLTILEWE